MEMEHFPKKVRPNKLSTAKVVFEKCRHGKLFLNGSGYVYIYILYIYGSLWIIRDPISAC